MLSSLIRWALARLSGFKPMSDETYARILASIEHESAIQEAADERV